MMQSLAVEMALTGYGRTVSPDASATTAARTLRDSDVSILVVEDDGVEGVVTESDFVAMVAETTESVSVSEIMSAPPVTASPQTSLSTVADRMARQDADRALVVDDTEDAYWGIVSTQSVAMHFADSPFDTVRDAPAPAADAAAGVSVTSD
ncbi:CBS domain-containing protein [Haloplanus sp. C73]|uniref:CBS domain-containing protein n=1 Tax=Haloplanus sp. C73 TaxID=3421641 RepID=UPI003EBC7242